MGELTDLELLDALGVERTPDRARARTPGEERVISGFDDIVKFYENHGRAPEHGEGLDIFERLYAVRLDRLREHTDWRELLRGMDVYGLLEAGSDVSGLPIEALNDEALLAELGVEPPSPDAITQLHHVRSREEKRAKLAGDHSRNIEAA